MALQDMVNTLDRIGVTQVLLPFILVFTIVFAVLQKTNLLGKEKKNLNVVIALIMGLVVVTPAGQPVVYIINNAIPNISIILVAILMLMIILGLIGGNVNFAGGTLGAWMVIFAIVAVALIFGSAAGWFGRLPAWLGFLHDPDTQAVVVIILVFAIVIWFITKEDKGGDDGKDRLKELSNIFGKKD